MLAAMLVTAAGSAAANVLVVRASGPSARSYAPGRSLPDNARIVLQAGDTLVILGANGTRTFRGPGTFSPSAAVQSGQRLASSGGNLARIGAVRNAGLVPRSPTIWHVDVTQSGTMCLASTSNVMLWRPDSSSRQTLTISGPGGRVQRVQWPAGRAVLAWPAGSQIASGASYSFQQPGVTVPVQITFRTLRSEPHDLQGVASALIENGCQEQLDLLVESAPDQAVPG